MGTFALTGKLGLDSRDFVTGAKKAEQAVGDVSDEMKDLPADAKKAGGDAGTSLGGSLAKGFAAVGVTALIAKGLNDAMDIEKGVSRVQAQFALTADDAQKYGKMGGDLYADAWGDSATDATTSIATVGLRLQDVGGIAETELSAITAQVMAVSDVFGQDFDAVVRSTGNLLKNGLAADAEEALDMVTVAFQKGGDQAGDLLDTIDEYAPYWAQLGIDGSEALGLITTGFQNGMRDADKLADALKEFNIKVLEEEAIGFFNALGLAGGAMQTEFGKGGESARVALGQVVDALGRVRDPIERNRIAVGLFGTMWEDLGPQALPTLQTLSEGLGEVEGAASQMAETVGDNTATAMEEMKRRIQGALAETAAGLLPILEAADKAGEQDYSGAIGSLKDFAVEYNIIRITGEQTWGVVRGVMSDAAETTGRVGDLTAGVGKAYDGFIPKLTETADGLDTVAGAAEPAASAIDATQAAAARAAVELQAMDDAASSLSSSFDDVIGRSMNMEEANQAVIESFAAATGAIKQNGASLDINTEKGRANRDLLSEAVGDIMGHATAMVENGASIDEASAAVTMHREALIAEMVAAGMSEEAVADYIDQLGLTPDNVTTAIELAKVEESKRRVDGHISKLGDIPESEMTEIQAAIDQGDYAYAESRLNTLARNRQVSITVSTIGGGQIYMRPGAGQVMSSEGRYVDRYMVSSLGEDGAEAVLPLTKPNRMSALLSDPRISGPILNAISVPAPMSAPAMPSPSPSPATAIANGNAGGMVDPVTWGRQAADAYSRRLQHNGRAA